MFLMYTPVLISDNIRNKTNYTKAYMELDHLLDSLEYYKADKDKYTKAMEEFDLKGYVARPMAYIFYHMNKDSQYKVDIKHKINLVKSKLTNFDINVYKSIDNKIRMYFVYVHGYVDGILDLLSLNENVTKSSNLLQKDIVNQVITTLQKNYVDNNIDILHKKFAQLVFECMYLHRQLSPKVEKALLDFYLDYYENQPVIEPNTEVHCFNKAKLIALIDTYTLYKYNFEYRQLIEKAIIDLQDLKEDLFNLDDDLNKAPTICYEHFIYDFDGCKYYTLYEELHNRGYTNLIEMCYNTICIDTSIKNGSFMQKIYKKQLILIILYLFGGYV